MFIGRNCVLATNSLRGSRFGGTVIEGYPCLFDGRRSRRRIRVRSTGRCRTPRGASRRSIWSVFRYERMIKISRRVGLYQRVSYENPEFCRSEQQVARKSHVGPGRSRLTANQKAAGGKVESWEQDHAKAFRGRPRVTFDILSARSEKRSDPGCEENGTRPNAGTGDVASHGPLACEMVPLVNIKRASPWPTFSRSRPAIELKINRIAARNQ